MGAIIYGLIAFGIIASIVDDSLVFGSDKTHVELKSSPEMYNIIATIQLTFRAKNGATDRFKLLL